jgi:uncharacterized protein (DUF433 family)
MPFYRHQWGRSVALAQRTVTLAITLPEPKSEMTLEPAIEGCYTASRAAALSGVPKSTVYEWARRDLLVPSVSDVREKLWSYADLMALRIIYWLRHAGIGESERVAASMHEVRRALERLRDADLNIWNPRKGDHSPLFVDVRGSIYIAALDEGVVDSRGASVFSEMLDLLGPFASDSLVGPDLIRPRPHLRIVPGRCSGEPHIERTRITTLAIKALNDRGFSDDQIGRLYPEQPVYALSEAIDLESSLAPSIVAA